MIARALARARTVIAVSEATRNEIALLFPGRTGRIAVVPNGVNDRFRPDLPEAEISRVTAKLALPAEYGLYVGGAKAHKNLFRVLEAFAASESGSLALIVAGATPKGFGGTLPPKAHAIGIVDDADLPALYQAARFLIYPTLAEGFGLPVLEAMACGIPVVASDIPAFRELTAGAALLVDPRDTSAIARAIQDLSHDATLRKRLAAAGLTRATDFSWDATAELTLEIYRKALAE
jgi:glycosyltransferase involved in cell wall biosynthesis